VTVRALVAKVATVVAAAVATAVLGACTGERPRGVSAPGDGAPASATDGPPRFQRLDAARTGVAFANTLPEAPDFNILNYLYYYNGGGVAVGDVDGDGLVDLYLSATACTATWAASASRRSPTAPAWRAPRGGRPG
jgi:hypothetical protein